jgi:SAM-dependent MidA family methyltransferase
MPHNPQLLNLVLGQIRQASDQRLTFADFMDLALYHPTTGYYSSQNSIIGPQGDYVTSPHLGHDFGELLAEQVAEFWQRLNRPVPFSVVEMGAGQGLITTDLLKHLQQMHPDCFAVLEYRIVEKSAALREFQQRQLAPWQGHVSWVTLAEIPDDSVTGCFLSNELVDALPVHLVERAETEWQEVYVTVADKEELPLQETLGPLSSPRLMDYFSLVEIDPNDPQYITGYRTEIHLAALDWLQTVAAKLRQGYVLTIDYGYPASRYYNRARSQGTLQCYYQHSYHNDPYINLGYQDITAHVNFTALERQGEACGLTTVGVTQQGMFLMALGLGDRLTALAEIQETDPGTLRRAIQRRDNLHQLMNPMGLGNFVVLIQSKGLEATPSPLKGLTIPPLV